MTDDLGHHGPKGRDRRTGGSAVSGQGKVHAWDVGNVSHCGISLAGLHSSTRWAAVTCGNCKRIMGRPNARPPSPSPDQVLAERGAVWMTYAQVISRTPNPPLHVSTWDQVWNRTARERLIDRAVRNVAAQCGLILAAKGEPVAVGPQAFRAYRAEFARLNAEERG